MEIAGDRIVYATPKGDVYLLTLADEKIWELGRIEDFGRHSNNRAPAQLSPDGKFLAWSGTMAGLHILNLTDPANPTRRLLQTGQLLWVDFDADSKILKARDGRDILSLPLSNWHDGALEISPDIRRNQDQRPRSRIFSIADSNAFDSTHKIRFNIRYGKSIEDAVITNRTATFPPGLMGIDHDLVRFYIDAFGQIFQIDVEKLPGYTPVE